MMKVELSQSFMFDAAHTLRRDIEAEGSRRVHGHTYHCEVTISGQPGPDGFLMDLGHFRALLSRVRENLDHRMLDDVPGLGPATLENLCIFIAKAVPMACAVAVWRASGDRCTVRITPA